MTVARSRRALWQRADCVQCLTQKRKLTTVYAVGEGWTGAFGNGRFYDYISGHFDERDDRLLGTQTFPIEIFNGHVKSCSLGWGHTAIIAAQTDKDGYMSNRILIAGRPQEFTALLRLKRLPKLVRDYAVEQTFVSISSSDPTWNPSELLGRTVSWLSHTFTPGVEDWDSARLQSSMPYFTSIALDDSIEAQVEVPVDVVCSAGFTAVRMESGSLYTFGLNGMGQCGVGYTSANVWRPQKVTGLSFDIVPNTPRAELAQTFPIVDVALGLQRK